MASFQLDYQEALKLGYTQEEIQQYLSSRDDVELLNAPTPTQEPTQTQQFDQQIEAQLNLVPDDAKDNMRAVATELQNEGILTPNVLAYTLGTIKHETAQTFKPIEEYGGREQAIANGYEGGENYYGRGYLQLTHKGNYAEMGKRIGVPDLAEHPEKALIPENAAKITAAFIKDKGVADLAEKGDFYEARGPINGTDQADTISEYTNEFLQPSLNREVSNNYTNLLGYDEEQLSPLDNPIPEDTDWSKKLNQPNVVNPYSGPASLTQGIWTNPQDYLSTGGHPGEDVAYNREVPQNERTVSRGVGGTSFSGFQPGGYGNWNVTIGQNPEEAAQMAQEEKELLKQVIQAKMAEGATSLKDIPELAKYENVLLTGHGANKPMFEEGQNQATGSAIFKEGSTGRSTGPHSHIEYMNMGELKPFSQFLQKYRRGY